MGSETAPTDVLIVCTRHRPDDVAGCLATIRAQTHLAPHVLVVDASDDDATVGVVAASVADWPARSRLEYLHATPSLTHQRTVGIAHTNSEIVHFVDDDVRLDRHCLESIMATFVSDLANTTESTRRILGVGAFMTGQPPRKRVKWIDRVAGLDSDHEGVVLPTGRNIAIITEPSRTVDVDWLSGAVMSYRRAALVAEPPDEVGFPFEGEDVDLSFRIARHGRLVVNPAARYVHLESQTNRVAGAAQAKAELCARLLRVANNPDRLSHRRAVIAAVVQYFKYAVSGVLTMSPRRLALARGTLQGLRRSR